MKVFKVYTSNGSFDASYTNRAAAQAHLDYVKTKFKERGGYIKIGYSKSTIKSVSSRKRPRKTQGTKVLGKLTFSNPTNSGKGTVKGYVSGRKGRNAKSTVVKRTSYKTRSGQRRVLEIVTTKKVIKALGRSKRRRY